jgi:hypothetical protein
MKADKPTRTAKPEEPAKNVIYLADYKRKKDEVKAVFKDSLDNKQVMQRYNINQPTLEERQERIKESIQRINKLMAELKQ